MNPSLRYLRLMAFAVRLMTTLLWCDLVLPRLGLGRLSARGRLRRMSAAARRFHRLAAAHGGLLIKLGQFLSTRLDMLPAQVTGELSSLQDEAPAVSAERIAAVIEAELGAPPAIAFAAFDARPLAAASLGQAHRAVLHPGPAAAYGMSQVVVKVQRPGIERIVEVDLAVLRRVAGIVGRLPTVSARVDLPALIAEFATTSRQEIDYRHEASAARRFRTAFRADARVKTPRIAQSLCTGRVLTLEDITAIKINDVAALRRAGIDPHAVADAFAAVMLDQFFVHRFFHADPHPGNVFVTPTADGTVGGEAGGTGGAGGGTGGLGAPDPGFALTFIDFGMMGEVSEALRATVRDFAIALAGERPGELVDSLDRLGVLLPSADKRLIERALAELFERFGGLSIAQLQRKDQREFAEFFSEFGDLLRDLPFQLPEDFLLIFRAVSIVSGLCSELDHEFNMWDAVRPYGLRLMREEGGNFARDQVDRVIAGVRMFVRLPGRIDDLVSVILAGDLAVQTPGVDRELRGLERVARRAVAGIVFAGLFIGGAVLFGTAAVGAGARVVGVVCMSGSLVPLAYALLARGGRD
ncbi:ABC1 kinase family protein [Brevibacterium moorei]|uniref:ABC1 kinase family protein n=1 Tax=Brevibacterium moorei TaxID=2968457 RepID=UPI00211BADD0|nr:AarF/UbiB family protein [Brevibacterium sp. 68QC2CO]MCQ9385712.1 AarF/UbiB family protein [Brevibacterium sp. 68QC2CO]